LAAILWRDKIAPKYDAREDVMRRSLTAMVVVGLLTRGGTARAEPLPMQRYLPAPVAVEAATAAFNHCLNAGHHVSVEVMNHHAMVLAALHHDLASLHSTYSAHAKAYTVLSYSYASGETTAAEITRRIINTPGALARIQGIPGLILAPGGVLIQIGGQTVGAIGVGGSSGPVNDELCAKAGIEKIKDRLTP
jgi:uncharacterized protein GlcG (DUF336 family)